MDENTLPLFDQESKKCTKCGENKPATTEFFHAHKRSPSGVRSVCKVCRSKDHTEHKEERSAKKKEHYVKNRERLLAITHEYYANHTEKQRELAKKRHWKNRDRNLKRMQANWDENRDALNEKRRPGANERFHLLYGNDLAFTLNHRVGALVRRTLRFSKKKDGKMKDILGFTVDELKDHIESLFSDGMSWDNFLSGEIHLDHKIPINFFKPESVDDPAFKECWALSNLQPLWARDNLSKGYKIL